MNIQNKKISYIVHLLTFQHPQTLQNKMLANHLLVFTFKKKKLFFIISFGVFCLEGAFRLSFKSFFFKTKLKLCLIKKENNNNNKKQKNKQTNKQKTFARNHVIPKFWSLRWCGREKLPFSLRHIQSVKTC